eukprot:CAMPEP_0178958268 /NCGR_PEP_ID=MMETSP0789-20121207/11506_1 /TAXON_ID=3005 /ORGANISM="Rhizosolenia setigera, Strain CCMP 1694" /LENGTH=287 /DNA_ID=CAMNT_0020640871 /DNA_START=18 /DNA_END=881 /DNA_ORIENTATION=+
MTPSKMKKDEDLTELVNTLSQISVSTAKRRKLSHSHDVLNFDEDTENQDPQENVKRNNNNNNNTCYSTPVKTPQKKNVLSESGSKECGKTNLSTHFSKEKNPEDYLDYLNRTKSQFLMNSEEENEEVVFSVKARLFEFITHNEDYGYNAYASHLIASNVREGKPRWVSRGAGTVKCLRDMEDGALYDNVRLVMYRGETNKLLLNHYLEPGLIAHSEKDAKGITSYKWHVPEDFSLFKTGFARTLALRFASNKDACAWKIAFENGNKATGDARNRRDPSCYRPGNICD